MSESKQPRLTKKGLPDKRAETSKKNLEKGKNIIKQALKESKIAKSKTPIIEDSSDEETDDDEEYEFELISTSVKSVVEPEPEPEIEVVEDEPEVEVKPKKKGGSGSDERRTGAKPRSKEIIQSLYNEIQSLRQSNEEVRSMFNKQQIDMNKKKLNTHIGILNQEMLLKF